MSNLQRKWIAITALALSSALLLTACDSLPWISPQNTPTPIPTVTQEGNVNVEGRIVPLRSSALRFQTSGEVSEVLVNEGDAVSQGDILVKLGKREPLEAVLSQANFELVSAQQALDTIRENEDLARKQRNQEWVEAQITYNQAQKSLNDLDTEDYRQRLDDLNIDVEDAKTELDDARQELDKYINLDPDNETRKNAETTYEDAKRTYNDAVYALNAEQYKLDQAKAAVDLAKAHLDDALHQLNKVSEGVDPDLLALAQSRVDLAKAQVAAAQRSLSNADLTAPYDGTIINLKELQPGDIVLSGQGIATIVDSSVWEVETNDLTELDVVKVEVGQKVQISPDALPDIKLKGIVDSIDLGYIERSGDVIYTVHIRLNDTDPRLRWGMTVTVIFD